MRLRHSFVALAALAVLPAACGSDAASSIGHDVDLPATTYAGSIANPLVVRSGVNSTQIVREFLEQQGRSAEGVTLVRERASTHARLTHEHFEQEIDGLRIHGAYAKATFAPGGALVHLIEKLLPIEGAHVAPALIDEKEALHRALTHHGRSTRESMAPVGRTGNRTTFSGVAGLFREPRVERVAYVDDGGSVRVGFVVETWTSKENQLHYTLIGGEGDVVEVENRTANDSYNIFPEDPSKGLQTIVDGPTGGPSQAGWLAASSQTTINISGNNARAYLDRNADNLPDAGGTTVTDGNFLATADLSASPTVGANREVAAQNLFFLNNRVHDILYTKGFNEAAGNFQTNNFGLGGAGNDPVLAEALDGSGTDNANFATPNDGTSPRMQMYVWNPSAPSGEVVVGGSTYGLFASGFGPALNTTGLSGALALANDGSGVAADACQRMPRGALTGKVALVLRGTCEFVTKVVNAQDAGAKGVIIINNESGNGAFSPAGAGGKIKIASGMVGQQDGAALSALLGSSATVRGLANPPIQVDGDLDSDIVYHEYGHGLTWRMIGGMSGPLAGAIGEGASDTLAFLINNGTTDGDNQGVVGEYASSDPNGIRRFAYAGYPYTYSDVGNEGYEVHNDGEPYAAAMWRLRELFLAEGLPVEALLEIFVDGMNYTPSTPAFEAMRDGMLQASKVRANGNQMCALIWQSFAERGVGVGAKGVVSRRGTVSITESFAVPANTDCE